MAASSPASPLRLLPQVDRLLATDAFATLLAAHPRTAVVREVRGVLDSLRQEAWGGGPDAPSPASDAGTSERLAPEALAPERLAPEALARRVEAALERRARPYYRRVVNATGVILHTNLGRAPLAPAALAAIAATAGSSQRLEVDPESGLRGGRDEGCAALLRELTGCAAATVVNNNAAATLLVLAALARGRGVVVSRGELVEIGGSYRIPEVMAESGATLVEVGTTNRTHLRDYQRVLEEDWKSAPEEAGKPPIGMLLKVHTSNYRVRGFTAEVPLDELVTLGRDFGVPVVHDLGSGCLIDLASVARQGLGPPDLGAEPRVSASLAAGADLVCFSGDKLLGGPQAGLILGTEEAVDRCRRHPLFRALRPGRLIYTALEATLRLYLDGEEEARRRVPALARLTAAPEELRRLARRLARRLRGLPGLAARVVPCSSQAGSGSLPLEELPGWGVELRRDGLTATALAEALRRGEPPVFARLRDDRVLLDVRTLEEGDLPLLRQRLATLVGAGA